MAKCALVLFSLALLPHALSAGDGVFEINADCANSGGCLSGDAAGYPVTIDRPGSYRLTGSLETVDVNQTLIEITVSDVSIDLNGFSLSGPVTCSGIPNACSAIGSGIGIAISTDTSSISIANGTIRGMGESGIELFGFESLIENLRFVENRQYGLLIGGQGNIVRNVIATRNGVGINNGGSVGAHVLESTVFRNTTLGVIGGQCTHVVSFANPDGSACQAVGSNRCETPTNCD